MVEVFQIATHCVWHFIGVIVILSVFFKGVANAITALKRKDLLDQLYPRKKD